MQARRPQLTPSAAGRQRCRRRPVRLAAQALIAPAAAAAEQATTAVLQHVAGLCDASCLLHLTNLYNASITGIGIGLSTSALWTMAMHFEFVHFSPETPAANAAAPDSPTAGKEQD